MNDTVSTSSGNMKGQRPAPPSANAARADRLQLLTNVWRSRPILSLILCGVLLGGVIVAGTAVLLSKLYDRTLADKERELQNIAMVIAGHIDHSFQELSLVENSIVEYVRSAGIATDDDLERNLSDYNFHLKLKDKQDGLAHVGGLILVNSRGKVVNWSRPWPVQNLNASDRDFFQRLKNDKHLTTLMTEPLRNRGNGEWTVHIVRKITSPKGEFLGLVMGAIEMPLLEKFFGTISLGPHSFISLFSNDAKLLARHPPAPGLIGKSFAANNKMFKNVLSKADSGTTRLVGAVDGKELLIAGQKLSGYPAAVTVGVTMDSALAGWRQGATYVIGASILMILVIGGVILIGTRYVAKNLREQNFRLDAALNNMSQGLCMFDAQARVVICNERYLQMYNLSPGIVKPGCSLEDLFRHRKEAGHFHWDPRQRSAEILALIAKGATTSEEFETPEGRAIRIVNHPLKMGGWIATHEDTTETKRREASFRLLFKNNPIPMWVYDLDSLKFLAVNEAALSHYGYSREQFMALTVADIRPPEDREKFFQFLAETRGNYAYQKGRIFRHLKADGSRIDVAIYSSALNYEDRPAALTAVIDITERQHAEDELRRARTFLDTVIENVPATIAVKNVSDHSYILINRAGEKLFGLARDKIIGRTDKDMFPPDYAAAVVERDIRALQSGQTLLNEDVSLHTYGNEVRYVNARRLAIHDDMGKPQYLLAVLEDITDRKQAEARIAHMAHHDALTDLPNRVLLRERLDQALTRISQGEHLAVFCLDLDNFKDVNDTLGHPVGDELLKAVAERLRGCAGEQDTIARLGGDEFAIIQTGMEQPAGADALARKIHEAVKKPYHLDGHHFIANVSIGIAVAPMDGEDANQLLKNADLALYSAKAEGRDTYRFFEAEMDLRLKARRELEFDLRAALVNGEFEVHYQPVVNLQTNEISGVEALLRWHHTTRGMISPAEFIPLAEEIGLISPLGEWVLRRACADAAAWPSHIRIAVNLSPAQLMNQSLVPVVISALATSGLPAQRLELEITEAVLMQNNEVTLTALHQLRALGARIVMDDFGTGYSSLSYLQSFPFDGIKIDRSFIKNLSEDNNNGLAIIRAITSLARNLKVTTTAEGVETEQQRDLVRAEGCTAMQGFLFSPAMPAKDIGQMFQSRSARAVSAA